MMRIVQLTGLLTILLFLSACLATVDSDNPLYAADDPPYLPELVGDWVLDGDWVNEHDQLMTISLVEDSATGEARGMRGAIRKANGNQPSYLELRPCLLGEATFLDIDDARPNGAHMIVRLDQTGHAGERSMSWTMLDAEKLYAYLQAGHGTLAHQAELNEEEELTSFRITAPTDSIREFLSTRYDEDLFVGNLVMVWKQVQRDSDDSDGG